MSTEDKFESEQAFWKAIDLLRVAPKDQKEKEVYWSSTFGALVAVQGVIVPEISSQGRAVARYQTYFPEIPLIFP